MLPVTQIRTDGNTQPRAMLDAALIAEYAEAMADGAQFPPVTVFSDGTDYWLVDGFHRLHAVLSLGLAHIDAEVRHGTLQEAQWYSYSVNQSHGLRRTNEDKRQAVKAALAHPFASRYSDSEIARHCGVSQPFVSSRRASYNDYKIEPQERVVTRGGSTYTMNTANIGRREEEEPEPVMWEIAPQEYPPSSIPNRLAVHFSSDSPEWNTPQRIIELAVSVLGSIDIDPCSNSHTSPNVPARKHYTLDDNGLAHTWPGKIYMNPPYGREIADWTRKLRQEWDCGNTVSAIALVPARTDTEWFLDLAQFPKCFIHGRLKFSDAGSAPFPSVAVYLGQNVAEFTRTFGQIGSVYFPVSEVDEGGAIHVYGIP